MRPDSKSDILGIIKAQIDFDQLRETRHVKFFDMISIVINLSHGILV